MKTIVTTAGDYKLAIEVASLAKNKGQFSVEISSNYSTARFPHEWRRVFQATMDRGGAEAIANALYQALDAKD